jgi:hypothetical protein
MSKRVATGPAWQVRQATQQGRLEEIQRKIIGLEDEVERSELHWFLLDEFRKKLLRPKEPFFRPTSVLIIPGWTREHGAMVKVLLLEIEDLVKRFQCTDKEGSELFAKLFEWTAGEIAQPFHNAYSSQEKKMLQTLYGVERATDEVPFG